MSRSYREPAYYGLAGADPKAGKENTSRALRALIRAQLRDIKASTDDDALDDVDAFIDDPRDVKRGSAGSKDRDHGWDYFGDGRGLFPDDESAMSKRLTRK